MKRNILRIFLIILLGFTFYAIFHFSSQNGTDSGNLSKKVMRKIVNIFPYTKTLSDDTKTKIVERSQPIIRKLAHFSIYIVVGLIIMTFISTYKLRLWKKLCISAGVGVLYAISDEVHQMFVPRKSSKSF